MQLSQHNNEVNESVSSFRHDGSSYKHRQILKM